MTQGSKNNLVVRSLTGAALQVEAEDEEGEQLVTSLVLYHCLEAAGGGYGDDWQQLTSRGSETDDLQRKQK